MENSIYNNTMYFGSNIYDDEVVNKLLYELIGSSLDRNVKDQAIVDDHDVYKGLGSDFKLSQRTNSLYGLPADALTLMIPNVDIVPERYKKRFIRKYGYNKPIQFETMLADGQLFNRVPHLYLCNGFLYYGLTIVVRMDQSIILAIHQSGTHKISASMITRFQSAGELYQLVMERATTTYTYYGSVSSILVSGHDAIRVSNLRQLADIMDLSEGSANYNSWNISFSTEIPNDPMLLATIPASIGTISGDADYAFKYATGTNTILRGCSGSMRILVEQRPNREAVFTPSAAIAPDINPIALTADPVGPILSLQLYGERGDEYQPYTSKSIRFWTRTSVGKLPNAYSYLINENDNSNIILKDTGGIYNIDATNIPNINSLITSDDTCPLYVDAQVYQKSLTGTLYDCPVKNSIEIQLNEVPNALEVTSTHYQRHSRVIGDTPYTGFQYDFKDFKDSKFKDDIRAYKLSKLKMLLNSNPDNYKKLAEVLYKKALPVRTACLSTTTSKLPVVTDTSFIATSVRDDTRYFDEPQNYIVIHSDMKYWAKPYLSLYINGIFCVPTYTAYHDFDIYIFFPRVLKQVANELDASDNISISDTPSEVRDIVVDIYFKSSVDPSRQAKSELTFSSTGNPQLLYPNGSNRSTIAINSLLAYNSVSKEFVDMSNFNFYTEVTSSKVKIDDTILTITHPTSIDIIYLITSDGEFFKTKDGEPIILSEETVQVPISIEDALLGNKEMDTDNLYISLNNNNYIGTSIVFLASDSPELHRVNFNDCTQGTVEIDNRSTEYREFSLPNWMTGSSLGNMKIHAISKDCGFTIPCVNPANNQTQEFSVGYEIIPRDKITDPLKVRVYDQTITKIHDALGGPSDQMAMLLATNPNMMSEDPNGLSKSVDGQGALWESVYKITDGSYITFGAHGNTWLLPTLANRMIYSHDGGKTFNEALYADIGINLPEDDIYGISKITYGDGYWLCCSTHGGFVFRSDDDGHTWHSVGNLNLNTNSGFWRFKYLKTNAGNVWVVITPSEHRVSFDDGETWNELTAFLYGSNKSIRDIAYNSQTNTFIILEDKSILHSYTGDLKVDSTFTQIGDTLSPMAFEIACVDSVWFLYKNNSIMRSDDNGLTWTTALSSDDDFILFTCATGKIVAVTFEKTYISSDHGATWTSKVSNIFDVIGDSMLEAFTVVFTPTSEPSPIDLYFEYVPYNWSAALTTLGPKPSPWYEQKYYEQLAFYPSYVTDPNTTTEGGFIADYQLFDRYQPYTPFNSVTAEMYFLTQPEFMTEFQILHKKYSQIYYNGMRISPDHIIDSKRLNTMILLCSEDSSTNPKRIFSLLHQLYNYATLQVLIPQMDCLRTGFYRDEFPTLQPTDRPLTHKYFLALSQKILSFEASGGRYPDELFAEIYYEGAKDLAWRLDRYRDL